MKILFRIKRTKLNDICNINHAHGVTVAMRKIQLSKLFPLASYRLPLKKVKAIY